ncbi:MAG: RraA family protein [Bacteroidales bacterium]
MSLFIVCYISMYSQTKDGVNLIESQTYSASENAELIKLYHGLRLTDVSDGLDQVGLPNTGLVNPEIHPAWVNIDDMSHIMTGIAATVRLVPTQRPDRNEPEEEYVDWRSSFLPPTSKRSMENVITPGTVLVMDDVEDKDIGTIGSKNIMAWVKLGAVGVVTDAGARDTDEIALQKIPLYLKKKGRGIRPGRNEVESVNRPVEIGGVLVCPGDVIVADGDGVVVVPRRVAIQVAEYAHKIHENDKAGRRRLYKELGIPLDETVN